MEDLEGADDEGYNNEEVENIIQPLIEEILSPIEKWEEKRIPQLINDIVERTMQQLNKMKKPYKYVVTCALI